MLENKEGWGGKKTKSHGVEVLAGLVGSVPMLGTDQTVGILDFIKHKLKESQSQRGGWIYGYGA